MLWMHISLTERTSYGGIILRLNLGHRAWERPELTSDFNEKIQRLIPFPLPYYYIISKCMEPKISQKEEYKEIVSQES